MDILQGIKSVEDLIKKLDKIIKEGARVNSHADEFREIKIRFEQFIRTFFEDARERIKDYEDSISNAATRDNWRITGIFIEQAKITQNYLISLKELLSLRKESEVGEDKLDVLKREVEEKKIETERRGAVVDTKIHGASIEIIDRLRNELKKEKEILEQIISMKKDLEEIKDRLGDIHASIWAK